MSIWRGLDASQLSTEDGCGTNPPFRASPTGERKDALLLLRSHGANTFRMRMWNDPCADGRCNASDFSYANLTGVMQMARRSRSANLTFVLDLHFSDWWADPAHQAKPHAWASLPFDELTRAVYEFSRGTVDALKKQGTAPATVQVGNEISNGMLWESAGQSCELGGRLWCGGDSASSWKRFASLVQAGMRGVRDACAHCEVAIHTDLGNHIHSRGIGYVIEWHRNLTALTGEHADRIGLSMYPQWDGGSTFESIATLAKLAQAFPLQRIYIAETAYPAAGTTPAPERGFPPSAQGQLAFLRAVRSAMASALPDNQNGGALWWEKNEHGAYNSLFDARYVARPALLRGFRDEAQEDATPPELSPSLATRQPYAAMR
jgi:arabinogalactan endo-1,4-beta-galactosidase